MLAIVIFFNASLHEMFLNLKNNFVALCALLIITYIRPIVHGYQLFDAHFSWLLIVMTSND